MAKLTVTDIKKQIAALEAKAARLAEEEVKASVGKVRALMNQLGVTLEHLSSTVARKRVVVKNAIVGKKSTAAKRAGKGVAKYRDPETGATWSGFGRAPGWIAGATSRDAFLMGRATDRAAGVSANVPATKKRAAAKKASAKKSLAKKAIKTSIKRAAAVTKKVAGKAPGSAAPKRKSSTHAAASKAAAKKAPKSRAVSAGAAGAPAAAENSGISTT